jgi:hypothetical protein
VLFRLRAEDAVARPHRRLACGIEGRCASACIEQHSATHRACGIVFGPVRDCDVHVSEIVNLANSELERRGGARFEVDPNSSWEAAAVAASVITHASVPKGVCAVCGRGSSKTSAACRGAARTLVPQLMPHVGQLEADRTHDCALRTT